MEKIFFLMMLLLAEFCSYGMNSKALVDPNSKNSVECIIAKFAAKEVVDLTQIQEQSSSVLKRVVCYIPDLNTNKDCMPNGSDQRTSLLSEYYILRTKKSLS